MPPHDVPMFCFDNLVIKNLTTYHCKPTLNIDIYPSTLEICINNLFSLDMDHPPPDPTRDHPTPPENHTYVQYLGIFYAKT